MIFGDLTPGQLARIPTLGVHLPPAVQILTPPAPCPLPTCRAVEVMAREVEGGDQHLYHRLPHQIVTLITPQEVTP